MTIIIVNIVLFFLMLLVYAFLIGILQSIPTKAALALDWGISKNLAFTSMTISATLGTTLAISVLYAGAVWAGFYLSSITIFIWSLMQLSGIARSAVEAQDPSHLIIGLKMEQGATRSKYIGQFTGTLLGSILGLALIFTEILPDLIDKYI